MTSEYRRHLYKRYKNLKRIGTKLFIQSLKMTEIKKALKIQNEMLKKEN